MKTKSFLIFLAAALAMTLVFAGCPGEATTETKEVKRGYASDAEDIMAAFEFANEVWLAKTTDLQRDTLVIPGGKTLHVNGQKVQVDDETTIVVEGALDLSGENSVIYSEKAGAILVNVTAALSTEADQKAHYGSASVAGTTGLVFVKNDGTGVISDSKYYRAGPAATILAGGTYVAFGDGTTSIVIGNTGVANGQYSNAAAGTLIVTGNLDFGTGFVNNAGYLAVYGELAGGTAAGLAVEVIKGAGQIYAPGGATITGGSISSALALKSASTFGGISPSGTLVTFGGALTADEGVLVTFGGPARFITAPSIDAAVFNGDAAFEDASTIPDAKFTGATPVVSGYLTVTSLSGNITVKSGSLSTNSPLTLGTDLGIILGNGGGFELKTNGELLGTGYEISGAGSLLNTDPNGTTVAFAATGITRPSGSGIPNIVFGGESNLIYTNNAKIEGFNLDVGNGGSISIKGANKAINITGGGSITAKAVAGTLGEGHLYIVTNAAGSLVAGTNIVASGSLAAGSYGTLTAAANFIYSAANTAQSYFVTSGTDAAFGTLSSYSPGENSGGGDKAGSIVLFTSNTLSD